MSEPKSPGWARAAQIGLGAIAVILYNSTSLPGDKRQAIWFLMYLSKKFGQVPLTSNTHHSTCLTGRLLQNKRFETPENSKPFSQNNVLSSPE